VVRRPGQHRLRRYAALDADPLRHIMDSYKRLTRPLLDPLGKAHPTRTFISTESSFVPSTIALGHSAKANTTTGFQQQQQKIMLMKRMSCAVAASIGRRAVSTTDVRIIRNRRRTTRLVVLLLLSSFCFMARRKCLLSVSSSLVPFVVIKV
jgi:hypothetical protein